MDASRGRAWWGGQTSWPGIVFRGKQSLPPAVAPGNPAPVDTAERMFDMCVIGLWIPWRPDVRGLHIPGIDDVQVALPLDVILVFSAAVRQMSFSRWAHLQSGDKGEVPLVNV